MMWEQLSNQMTIVFTVVVVSMVASVLAVITIRFINR